MTEGGFGRVEAIVEGLDSYRGHKVKVLAKNENYLVRCVEGMEAGAGSGNDGAVLACTPDLICVVDSETGKYGDKAIIIITHNHIIMLYSSPNLSSPVWQATLSPQNLCAMAYEWASWHFPLTLVS